MSGINNTRAVLPSDVIQRAQSAAALMRGFDLSSPGPAIHLMPRQSEALPDSSGSARYDGGIATAGGVSSSPSNTGAALDNALAGMVADVKNRASSFPDVPVPGMPTNSETQVIIREGSGGSSRVLMLGTVFCVAAAAVTLYRAAKRKREHG